MWENSENKKGHTVALCLIYLVYGTGNLTENPVLSIKAHLAPPLGDLTECIHPRVMPACRAATTLSL